VNVGWHPASRVVEVGGTELHYVDQGEGEIPIILIHGYLMSSYMWRHNMEHLAQAHRVIVPCLAGFGWSELGEGPYDAASQAMRLVGLLDVLGIERAHLVGHSMGGAIALWLAGHQPQRVERLVLVDALALKGTLPVMPWGFVRRGLAPLYRAVVRPAIARAVLDRYAYGSRRVDDAYMGYFMEPLRRPGAVGVALEVARELRSFPIALDEHLSAIDRETLVIWGDSDRLLPVRVGVRLAARIPRAKIVVFEACGHSPHEEQPERFNDLVTPFFTAR